MREKQALTTGEVAKFCGVNFRTVIRWIERGHLEAYKLPGRGDNRIPVPSFIEFLQNNNMPVPDELAQNGRTLLLFADNEAFSAELASFARRAGWEALLTNDPLQFGYLLASRQPAAVLVTTVAAMESVSRLFRDAENRDMLHVYLSRDVTGKHVAEGWHSLLWPKDQQALLALLSNDAQA